MATIPTPEDLQTLQNEYRLGLDDRLRAIQGLFKHLHSTDGETGYSELIRLVHNLCGSAETFGYEHLSEVSRALEQQLRGEVSNHAPISTKSRELVDSLSDAIATAIDHPPAMIKLLHHPDPTTRSSAGKTSLAYIVEDDKDLCREIEIQLRDFGYDLRFFNTSEAALQAIAEKLPDVLVIDIILPDGDMAGTELADAVKEFDQNIIPTIFMSNRTDWDARLAAFRAGGKCYMDKPLDFSKFLNQLDRMTGRTREPPFRVLIIDDDWELSTFYAGVLTNEGIRTEVLTDPEKVLDRLAEFLPELIILDLYMPDVSGLELAAVLRQHQDYNHIPIVFLSTEMDKNVQLIALKEADDFLEKPIDEKHLVSTITARARRARAIGDIVSTDSLTGLLNHSNIINRLSEEVARAQRSEQSMCYAMIDLDLFKGINDRYGHVAGDVVIKTIALVLRERLRRTDHCGRYGGEEFSVVFPNTQLSQAVEVLKSIQQEFNSRSIVAGYESIHCTFSVGVAQMVASDSALSLLQKVDQLLYRAKDRGRDRIEFDV